MRPRRSDDLPGCVAALRLTYEADRYPSRWPADPAGWLSPAGLVGAWVAVRDGRVAGHAALRAEPADGSLGRLLGVECAAVARLFVAPAHRTAGLAAGLLAEAVRAARDSGRPLGLDVVADAPAARFYERLGWSELARGPADWHDASGGHPEVRYLAAPT